MDKSSVSPTDRMAVRVVLLAVFSTIAVVLAVLYASLAIDEQQNNLTSMPTSYTSMTTTFTSDEGVEPQLVKIYTNADLVLEVYYSADQVLSYQGIITLPNPCYDFEHNLAANGLDVELELTTTQPADDIICSQAIENRSFSGQLSGVSDQSDITASLDGEELE